MNEPQKSYQVDAGARAIGEFLKDWKPRESEKDAALRKWMAMQARCRCKPEFGIQASICRSINSVCCQEHCPRVPY